MFGSRELNELRKPSSENPEILRFFKYMKAAKDGQDNKNCEIIFSSCVSQRSPDDSVPMMTTYNEINKLVQARNAKRLTESSTVSEDVKSESAIVTDDVKSESSTVGDVESVLTLKWVYILLFSIIISYDLFNHEVPFHRKVSPLWIFCHYIFKYNDWICCSVHLTDSRNKKLRYKRKNIIFNYNYQI